MAGGGHRVVINNEGVFRAVCKVQPLSDGGYTVLVPYHAAREGWLAKYQVDYNQTFVNTRMEDAEHFSASDRVKLSHHLDGFVQFSSENAGKIRSGRDPITGQPKGLAIMSAPIVRPVMTGPTFGIVLWGINDFEQVEVTRETDVTFGAYDTYYRDCTPDTFNAYLIEGWIFGANMWAGVRGPARDLRLSMGFRNFEGTGANLEFRVLPLINYSCFVALMASKIQVSFGSKSGFQLSSPSDRRRGAHVANALMAFYPKIEELDPRLVKSLDYTPND